MPIGFLKILRISSLPTNFAPTLPTGGVSNQVRYLQARFHGGFGHEAAFDFDAMPPHVFQIHTS